MRKWEIMNLSNRLWELINPYQNILRLSATVVSFVFALLPDNVSNIIKIYPYCSDYINAICFKVILAVIIGVFVCLFLNILRHFCSSRLINGRNYSIRVQYGNLFDEKNNGKIVIPFDECFTVLVDDNDPGAINSKSICGQYLKANSLNSSVMIELIHKAGLRSMQEKSRYKGKVCYETGSIVPKGKWLLLAFSKIDESGRARMSYDDYVKTLKRLWCELDRYYGQKDIYIPILGSGTTRIDGYNYTKQELLDIIIGTYKLSPYKLKLPNKLHIICENNGDISLTKIGKSI